jgi:hypothetical protein
MSCSKVAAANLPVVSGSRTLPIHAWVYRSNSEKAQPGHSPGGPPALGHRLRLMPSPRPTSTRITSHPTRPGARSRSLPCRSCLRRFSIRSAGRAALPSGDAGLRSAGRNARSRLHPAGPTRWPVCPAILNGPAGRGSRNSTSRTRTRLRDTSVPGLLKAVWRKWKAWLFSPMPQQPIVCSPKNYWATNSTSPL